MQFTSARLLRSLRHGRLVPTLKRTRRMPSLWQTSATSSTSSTCGNVFCHACNHSMCNEDPCVLRLLAQLGTGFDCASKAEIKRVLDMKVDPNRIIYANPCKQTSYIKYAAKHGVSMMTFDNETEQYKVKSTFPNSKLVIRIMPPDDSKSQCPLGVKFGCDANDAGHLLRVAKEFDLNVIGVSFHVGSGCNDATAFSEAVASAHSVFQVAEDIGFHFDLLDIGGGFPGQWSDKITLTEICDELTPALDRYFPESSGVRVIAEPGRYFVASAFTLAVNIIAKRAVRRDGRDRPVDYIEGLSGNDELHYMYYVNDGVYGSFNCLIHDNDHSEVEPSLLEEPEPGVPSYSSSLWGPTCDELDCIKKQCLLPELNTGDWLVFRNMGAYTMCAASAFNGMPKPYCYHTIHESCW
ncbi:Ornithine decarboxylase [Lamellibrachia satsuma]|nr:Ornithine decarboxylase [Lamellibrachia satsuma]